MISADTSFASAELPTIERLSITPTAPGELNTYAHDQALIPDPLVAKKSQTMAKRANTTPIQRESTRTPHLFQRNHSVNATAMRANNLVASTHDQSRNLIDDFLKNLADGAKTPRNLIDDFLNELAHNSTPPNRSNSGRNLAENHTSGLNASTGIHPTSETSLDFLSWQGSTMSMRGIFPMILEHASVLPPSEAAVLAKIAERSSAKENHDIAYYDARILNIPRRRRASEDLRAEYKKVGLEIPSETNPRSEKPSHSLSRPVLSLITKNIETLRPKDFIKPEQAKRPSQSCATRPRLSLDTHVGACDPDTALERKAGEDVKAFYLGLINGDIDVAAYIDCPLSSAGSGLQETELLEHDAETPESELTFSAVSKTSLELEYEAHEEAFYMGLINGDSDSETSSKYSVDSPVSPSPAAKTFVRSAAPSPKAPSPKAPSPASSLAASTPLIIQVPSPIDGICSSRNRRKHATQEILPNGREGHLRNLLAKSILTKGDKNLCIKDELQSLHGCDENQPTGCTCKPSPESQPVSEPDSSSTSNSRVQHWLTDTEHARQYWDQQKASRRLRRRATLRQSQMQASPFFHAAR